MKKLTKDKNFSNRLDELIKKKLGIKQVDFCKKLGITQGYLSMVLAGKRGPSADLIAGIFLNYSEYLEWLLTGSKSEEKSNNLTRVIIEHQDIVKQFKDPERAKNINKRLLEIEDLSDDLYNKVDGYIEASRDAARAIKESSKKISKKG